MSEMTQEKELNSLNQALKNSAFFSLMRQLAGNDRWTAAIILYTAPAVEKIPLKDRSQLFRETRSQMNRFFRQEQKKLAPAPRTVIISLPDPLCKMMDGACRPAGFNRKLAVGEELFSIAALIPDKETGATPEEIPGVAELLGVLALFGPADLCHRFAGVVSASEGKIRQITPLDFREASREGKDGGAPHFLTLEQLKELENLHKNFLSLDPAVRETLTIALNVFRAIRGAREPFLRFNLLLDALYGVAGFPENEPHAYVPDFCAAIGEKMDFKPAPAPLFKELFAARHSLLAEGINAKKILTNLGPGGTLFPILSEGERFLAELLKKAIADPLFWKKTVPAVKADVKREIRREQNKRRWRLWGGRRLERLLRPE